MRRHFVSVVIASVAAIGLAVSSPQAQRELRERSVAVSVVGSDQAPVSGLTAGDFVVREDGLAREVLRVGPAPLPTHLLLLVDDSQVTEPATSHIRTALIAFVRKIQAAAQGTGADRQMPQIALTTFGERPTRRVEFTPNPALVERGAERLFSITAAGAYLLEALVESARDLRKREAERPVVVALVDEHGPEFSNLMHQDVASALEAARATFWAVTLQASAPDLRSTEARERAAVLGDVTRLSGGANYIVLTPLSLDVTFGKLAAEITSRYLVTYGRPDSLVPPKRVEVEVNRRDVRVRAPQWAGR